jgi:hypothetical protein
LESQFRCGKCGKPISSKYTKCLDCGSLGPHTFSGSAGSSIEGGPPVSPPPKRRDSYPAERIDRPEPPPSRPERYVTPEPADIPSEPARSLPSRDFEDDSRFPVGMRSRSPILDYVENIDESSEEKPGRKRDRDRDEDYADVSDDNMRGVQDDDDQEVRTSQASQNSTVTLIVSITLILILIVAVLYVFNNFDAMTKWLASPTIPDVLKPSN